MEAVTLPCIPSVGELSIKKMITVNNALVSSIKLESPHHLTVSESVSTLNSPRQVDRLNDMSERRRMLKLHGIPATTSNQSLREYVLFLFQTHVLAIFRSKKQTAWLAENHQHQRRKIFQKVAITAKGKEVSKVQAMAIRALYALGLDYGSVKCGIAQGNRVVVLHVNPKPQLSVEIKGQFLKSLQQYMDSIAKGKVSMDQIYLGADPEFVVQSSKGNLVIASRYLPIRGKVGCDAIWIGKNRSQKPVVEVRPNPTTDPRKLVVRIYEHLLLVCKKMNAVSGKWLAGALPYQGFPLGGHIHFSGIKPNFKMLRALDNYLSLPLILVEDQKGIKRRPKYGFLGDYRLKNHGGFEYRTPPSWLVSPTITKGVLALAKCIVSNYSLLSHDPLSEPDLQRAYYLGNKQRVRDWIDFLWADLRRLDDYHIYQSYLDGFYRYLLSGRTWNESEDFRKLWRLPPYHKGR